MRDKTEVEVELERICRAFLPYLRGQREIDILYSEKAGYFMVQVACSMDEGAVRLDTVDKLLDAVFYQMADAVVFQQGSPPRDPMSWRLTPGEMKEVRCLARDYLSVLGEDSTQYLAYLDSFLKSL